MCNNNDFYTWTNKEHWQSSWLEEMDLGPLDWSKFEMKYKWLDDLHKLLL